MNRAERSVSPKREEEEATEQHTDELGEEELAYDDSGIPASNKPYVVKELSKDFVIFRWKVQNLESLPQRMHSEEFFLGAENEHNWRLLLFPHGNTSKRHMALYLEIPGVGTKPYTWSRYAEFRLGIINQKDIRKSKFQESRKTYRREVQDWGFGEFILLKDLNEETGFMVDNTVIMEVRIEVKKNEHSGYAFAGYDSRVETGFVGIQNQGATCYLNSVIQTLYHLSGFRRSVFQIDVSDVEDPTKSIPMALQQLFFNMQYSKNSVSTTRLTTSFGWGAMEAFVQHDVQELLRVLLDNLSEKMKSTPLEGTIDNMFGGKLKNYVQCVNVDYGSSWLEPFYDIQLVVKGKKDLLESLEAYCEVEMLDGQNQYEAEGFGKQDAKKGVLFSKVPPVLVTHLKRFEYDWEHDRAYKVNDRFEFPVDVSLERFLAEDGDHSVPSDYSLLSILVHSGGAQGGHYYAYIRPGCKGERWLKFDDERVTPAAMTEAVEENFGGEEKPASEKAVKTAGYPNWDVPVGHVQRFRSVFKRYANAYMLVYVRTADMDKYLKEVEEEEIPEDLRARFEEEERQEAERRLAEKEKYLSTEFRVFTEKDLVENPELTFGLFDTLTKDESRIVRVKKTEPAKVLVEKVAEMTGISPEEMQIWKFSFVALPRPDRLIDLSNQERSVEAVMQLYSSSNYSYSYGSMDSKPALFVTASKASPPLVDRLLFFKFYDFETSTMRYLGKKVCEVSRTVEDVVAEVLKEAGLPDGRAFVAFRETKSLVSMLRGTQTLREIRFENGDPIIIQWEPTAEERASSAHAFVADFFRYMGDRKVVRLSKLEDPNGDEFTLQLSLSMPYDAVTAAIGEKIGADGKFIRLTAHSTYLKEPRKQPLSTRSHNLKDMLLYANTFSDKLYYEVMEEPVAELENKKEITVQFFNAKAEKEKDLKLVVPKRSNVAELVRTAAQKLELPEETSFRLAEVYNGKFTKVYAESESVEYIRDSMYSTLRLEVVTPEERAPVGGRTVQVVHFCKDDISVQAFGNPFYLGIGPDETFASVRQRVLNKLDFDPEEVEKWNLATLVYSKASMIKREAEEETKVLAALAKVEYSHSTGQIGLEHANPDPEDTLSDVVRYPSNYRRAGHQASIKIHN